MGPQKKDAAMCNAVKYRNYHYNVILDLAVESGKIGSNPKKANSLNCLLARKVKAIKNFVSCTAIIAHSRAILKRCAAFFVYKIKEQRRQ